LAEIVHDFAGVIQARENWLTFGVPAICRVGP